MKVEMLGAVVIHVRETHPVGEERTQPVGKCITPNAAPVWTTGCRSVTRWCGRTSQQGVDPETRALRCGTPSSSAPSSDTSGTIASSRCGSWSHPQVSAEANWQACADTRSTSSAAESRRACLASSWPGEPRSPRQRPGRAFAPWLSIPTPWPPWTISSSNGSRSVSSLGQTRNCCSCGQTVGRSTRTRSPLCSTSTVSQRGFHASDCTTYDIRTQRPLFWQVFRPR